MALSRSLLPSNAGAGMVGPREILAGCSIGGDWIASSIPRPIKDLKNRFGDRFIDRVII